MKVAIQFSGLRRDYNQIFANVKTNLIDPLGADLFIATWNTPEHPQLGRPGYTKCHGSVEDFVQMYQPVRHKVFEHNAEHLEQYGIQRLVDIAEPVKINGSVCCVNAISSMFALNQCNKLRQQYTLEQNIKYDLVICSRTELTYDNPIPHEDLENAKSQIGIPLNWDCLGYTNMFAIGPPQYMDIYCGQISEIENYVANDLIEYFHPEYYINKHLAINNVPVFRTKFKFKLRGKSHI